MPVSEITIRSSNFRFATSVEPCLENTVCVCVCVFVCCVQEERGGHLVQEMKRLKFIPLSWSPNQSTPPPPPDLPQRDRGERESGEREGTPQPEKLAQLRDYLGSIEKTPVQRVRASESLHLWCVVSCVSGVCVYLQDSCPLSLPLPPLYLRIH